ncbi:MAG: ArdC-like ssDNA-binding domain-containing protein [Nanoarchaeota archaeon]|nr:ArdC-like ssDNA-binding domain-containing protein [Nanoarchaeota archaeon]
MNLKEVEQALKQLASETEEAKKSQFFKEYLNIMSRFWDYSPYNQLLIYLQMPNAARVAGFHKWKQLGRSVIKGSRAIRILAPAKSRKIEDEKEETITYFRRVSVFDISQTEGKPLPDIDIEVKGETEGLMQKLLNFCQKQNLNVAFEDLREDLHGYAANGNITINSSKSNNTQINALLHEIAHALLHNTSELSKEQKEIQAEAVAFVTAKHFNMETKSFNYLALYNANQEKIMQNLKDVAGCAKTIINGTL